MTMGFSDVYRSVLKEYPDILTVEEMSKALGVSTKTGYKLIRENKWDTTMSLSRRSEKWALVMFTALF